MTDTAKTNSAQVAASSDPTALPEWKQRGYDTNPPTLKKDVIEIFEKYAKIPADRIEAHVTDIRDKAYNIHPYPCIGRWRFLELAIGRHRAYPEVLERMKTGEQIYLDLGCAFAGDLRRLVYDGVDSSKLYGSDLRLSFIDLGYELYKDKDTLKSTFIEADIFDPSSDLKQLDGKVDIVDATSFFHLFNLEEQKKVAHRVVKLMKPQKDSLLLGFQVGQFTPGERPSRNPESERTMYRHNLESWKKFWKGIGEEEGVQFQVDGKEIPLPEDLKMSRGPDEFILMFTVRRE